MSPRTSEPDDRTACTPCHGTGKLSSNQGGASHEVPCPWCEGSGAFAAGRDAQTHAVDA